MSIQRNILPDNPQIEVIKSGKTGLFTNYIYKAIPLAFDESMSYYETLLGLLNYLKNVIIPTVNNNADAVSELQTLYEELRTYVDDYFKGLDVQEEINNKLDEMVESGELQNIISEFLELNSLLCFDNVENMINSVNVINGSFAKTLGFNNINDGGSALYKIRNITNQDVIDNASIIPLNKDNLIAELIYTSYINVKQFGAKGDGITDDSEIIQKTIDFASNKKLKVIIDGSTYIVNNTLLITGENANIECNGTLKTTNGVNIINISGSFHNINIDTLKSQNRSGIGILSQGALSFSNINIDYINDFDKGISLDTSTNTTGGITYNHFKSSQIVATKCIYLNANNRYINQNYFYMGSLMGGTAINNRRI